MITKIFHKLFLIERPSISLSLFRIAAAITTGLHVIPSFFYLGDNYFRTAFKTHNANFFPLWFLEWIAKSPEWLVVVFIFIFCLSCFFFLIGFLSQLSCIVMVAACYYFYALNSFHVGTLSWDILLVALFLMCVTSYHGDYFSVDCLRKKDEQAYRRKRPYFIQRLLQLQIGFTFFYTALYKITVEGNWITGNPIYYILNYPPAGTTKTFLLRDVFRTHPQLCYIIGLTIVGVELLMIFLLYYRKTRISAIYLGCVFHIVLILTLDVPAIFLFLFPPMLFLFINPENITRWIESKRQFHSRIKPKSIILFDGRCQFCQKSVLDLKIMDLFAVFEYRDLHEYSLEEKSHKFDAERDNPITLRQLHPDLTKELAMSQIHLIDRDGHLYGGFAVLRRISFMMPMMWPCVLLFYFPGMGIIGPLVYKIIAKNRYLFHLGKSCRNNACYR